MITEPLATPEARQATPLDCDPDLLREKYKVERDRRLRKDANDQYIEAAGDFAHYIEDPYVEPGFAREPVTDTVEVLVIGGGLGGLVAAAALRKIGISDLRIIEKGGDFGGTWYWNRYPGAQCDIESYIYLPLLEETGYIPKEKYSHGNEIQGHARRIGETFDLYRQALFQTQTKQLRWLEDEKLWLVETDREDAFRARFVLIAAGPLNRPKLPGIPGIESFQGHSFHTSRWDYSYTGGDWGGGLTKLADKRVAVIGTGATSIQCVPYIARDAKHLYVIQRTPSAVSRRDNRPTDPKWVRSLKPGWQKERAENFNILINGGHQDSDLVADGWVDLFRMGLDEGEGLAPAELQRVVELADYRKMDAIRARVDEHVRDPKTAEALKPWYRVFCKRPGFNDDYLATFNQSNVTLLDTLGLGPDRITADGIVVQGTEYPVDCLILSTGFEVGTSFARRAGVEIYGTGGQTLTENWADGPKTLHGFFSHGFPNLFHMGLTQTGLIPNWTHLMTEVGGHVAEVIRRAREVGAHRVEPTEQAQSDWVRTIEEKANYPADFRNSCTPGYYNGEGAKDGKSLFDGQYGPGPMAFWELMAAWRAQGRLEGLDVR